MTKSKPRRTIRTLDTAALATATGGADLVYSNTIGGGLLGLYTGVNDGGLLGAKSLTSGVGGLIAT